MQRQEGRTERWLPPFIVLRVNCRILVLFLPCSCLLPLVDVTL